MSNDNRAKIYIHHYQLGKISPTGDMRSELGVIFCVLYDLSNLRKVWEFYKYTFNLVVSKLIEKYLVLSKISVLTSFMSVRYFRVH